jgi:hypothetical protein
MVSRTQAMALRSHFCDVDCGNWNMRRTSFFLILIFAIESTTAAQERALVHVVVENGFIPIS